MATDTSNPLAPLTVDLTGLPEDVVRQITHLVRAARERQAGTGPTGGRAGLVGALEHLGIKTPTFEEFDAGRRSISADFPREFPDPSA